MGRKDAWQSWEEVALAEAWLGVSQDSIVGRYQSSDTFYERILDVMVSKLQGRSPPWQQRNTTAIRGHFNEMSRESSKMSGYYSRSEASMRSGQGPEDVLAGAKALYERDCKKKFKYEAFWTVVRHAPKWQSHLGSTSAHGRNLDVTSSSMRQDASSTAVDPSATPAAAQRPAGAKHAKSAAQHADAVHRLALAAEVQNQQARHKLDLRIVGMRLADYDDDVREAIKFQRDQAVLRLSRPLSKQNDRGLEAEGRLQTARTSTEAADGDQQLVDTPLRETTAGESHDAMSISALMHL